MKKHASNANVRHYVIYDFEGKAPRTLYCLRERLESGSLAEWIQYSIIETKRLDIVLQIACFCAERGGEVEIIRGRRYAVK
jgi:hypothetical protein